MKILFLTDKLMLGGAETHIFDLMRELEKRGHTVELGCDGGDGRQRFIDANFRLRYLPFATKPLRAAGLLYELILREKYDLVHSHARRASFFAAPICRRRKIPFLTTAHWVFRADGWRGRFTRWGDATFAVSEDIRDYLKESYGLGAERITVLPNGVDTAHFATHGCPETGKIVHISRLDSDRADMAKALLSLAPDLAAHAKKLTVVGGGECFGDLKRMADEVNRRLGREFVEMTGARADVLPYLYESNIFVGVSRAALEAMSCGLAVVLGGNEGYLGPLVTKQGRERAALGNFCCRGADAIKADRLLSDLVTFLDAPAYANATGQENAAFVRACHTTEQMADGVEAVYRKFVSSEAHPTRVLLAGYCGFGNLGDEAILWGMLSDLRNAGFTEITVLSANPQKTERQFGVRCISREDPSAIDKALAETDIFVLGGGNLLQNETSNRSLYYYTQLLFRAKRAGCYTVLRGGIGGLSGAWARKRARSALLACDLLLLRTPNDIKRARQLLKKEQIPIRLVPDEVLFLPSVPETDGSVDRKRRLILLCTRGSTPSPEGIRETAALCKRLEEEHGLYTAVYAMHPSADEDTARRLAEEIRGATLLPTLSPTEFLALAKSCALIISARLHPLIFAARCGTPAIGFSDGGKTDDFFDFMCEEAPDLSLTRLPLGWDASLAGGVLGRAAEGILVAPSAFCFSETRDSSGKVTEKFATLSTFLR